MRYAAIGAYCVSTTSWAVVLLFASLKTNVGMMGLSALGVVIGVFVISDLWSDA
jgi:hypothetical protein